MVLKGARVTVDHFSLVPWGVAYEDARIEGSVVGIVKGV